MASIDNDIQNVTITEGEHAAYTCQFSRRGNNITVFWRVGDVQYGCDTESGRDECHFVLRTATGSAGIHPVQCVLQHIYPSEFAEDASFRAEFNEPLTKSALLTILPTGEFLCSVSLVILYYWLCHVCIYIIA